MGEDDSKRRMTLISVVLRSRQQLILKTGTEWEIMLDWSDATFAHHLRISKHQFEYLLTKLQENDLHSDHAQGRPPVPDTKKLLMFLWYMANQNSFREMNDKFDVSQSAVHRIILQVLTILSGIVNTFISWPNACEKAASAAIFHRTCGLDGAIDGCHIKVQRPPLGGGDYMNRKAYYSVLLQGMVDDRGRFIYIFSGPPGRVHEARMLRSSTFYTQWQEKMGEHCLLGDSAYIGKAFPLIKSPKCDNGAVTMEDLEHNAKISQGRIIVENAFGRMKCKWRRLHDLQNTHYVCLFLAQHVYCCYRRMCRTPTWLP